jgi:hypothetical protein
MFMLNDLYGPPPYPIPGEPYVLQMNPCAYQAVAEGWSDFFWKLWSVDDVANYLTINQPGDVYAYQFLYGAYKYEYSTTDPYDPDCEIITSALNAWPDFSPGPNFALWFGALHSLDSPFLFGDDFFLNPGLSSLIFNPGYTGWGDLSDAMIDYLVQFARTGDPGDAGGVNWMPWSTPTGPRILFDADAEFAIIIMSSP